MAEKEVVKGYVATFQNAVESAAPLSAAADALIQALDKTNLTAEAWNKARQDWNNVSKASPEDLAKFLLLGLPALPALRELVKRLRWEDPEGLRGGLTIGPVRLEIASMSLLIDPPIGIAAEPIVVGPLPPNSLSAVIGPPLGDGDGRGLPGGGEVVRLADGSGFGGRLSLPLGPVSVDATALLGKASFLAVMGVSFTPPLQLSFGFSLDRVGGVVGVNRRMDTDALALAVRTGAGGDALFASKPPSSAAALVADLSSFFPEAVGSHVVGPTLRLSWLSTGAQGSFVSLDLAVVLELPSGRMAILGVARAAIPALPGFVKLRADVLGVVDPIAQLVSIDGSLVDSELLQIFAIYGDAAVRVAWGAEAYTVLSIGGFYPGFDPEPARLPALRRAGMATQAGGNVITVRVEGYFAATSNTLQLGGRYEVRISLGVKAHGFLQADALVQFRPFRFEAACAAGFNVSYKGISFGSVRLDGTITGPGPVTIRGRLTIETFLLDVSWDETFTLGSGPADVVATVPSLLDVFAQELGEAANLHAEQDQDPVVVLKPRPGRPGVAAVPPTGSLRWTQRRAPIGVPIDRVDGQPLESRQGVQMQGPPVFDRFAPGSYCNLTSAQALNLKPFDTMQAGVLLSPPAASDDAPWVLDERKVDLVVVVGEERDEARQPPVDLSSVTDLVSAAARPPTISKTPPLLSAHAQKWRVTGLDDDFHSITQAHQIGGHVGAALAFEDANSPIGLEEV